jgi:hypothetical protein
VGVLCPIVVHSPPPNHSSQVFKLPSDQRLPTYSCFIVGGPDQSSVKKAEIHNYKPQFSNYLKNEKDSIMQDNGKKKKKKKTRKKKKHPITRYWKNIYWLQANYLFL